MVDQLSKLVRNYIKKRKKNEKCIYHHSVGIVVCHRESGFSSFFSIVKIIKDSDKSVEINT